MFLAQEIPGLHSTRDVARLVPIRDEGLYVDSSTGMAFSLVTVLQPLDRKVGDQVGGVAFMLD